MRLNSGLVNGSLRLLSQTFGEPVRITPRKESEYSGSSLDASRAPVDVRAIVALTPMTEAVDGLRRGGPIPMTGRRTARAATIWINPTAYAAIGYDIAPGDAVTLLERSKEALYRVSVYPEFSDRGDAVIHLILDK